MENDNHKIFGDTRNMGDEDYKVKLNEITAMATLHRYKRGHTPRIQKGAKTSNSGVERNTIHYTA